MVGFLINFCISPTLQLFHKIVDCVLVGLKGTTVFWGDILVSGKYVEEHDFRLKQVLMRLRMLVSININKYEFQKISFKSV